MVNVMVCRVLFLYQHNYWLCEAYNLLLGVGTRQKRGTKLYFYSKTFTVLNLNNHNSQFSNHNFSWVDIMEKPLVYVLWWISLFEEI